MWLHRRLCVAVSLLAFAAVDDVPAQSSAARISPLEMLVCHFVEGKGPNDLDGLARGFNEWMERTSAPAYAAYTLFPLAHSDEIDFDLAWIGAWPDGTTMGASMAHYFTHGEELGPVFGSVMDCNNNRNFSVLTIRAPAEAGRFGPLEVANCKLRIGSVVADALNAVRQWVEYSRDLGSDAAHWALFPAYGEHSDAQYNFKWAVGYGSYESFGRDYDQFTNGDGLEKYGELFAPLMSCDSPRLYSVRPIRLPRE
ncbi:MAG TPA: hypothetical protein VJA26_12735 [Gammaproteobacteria bacterium]|nr:hypothetical protein [Gammaproteobacteria bacterium]